MAYSAAVAHWLISIVEDNAAGVEIISQVCHRPTRHTQAQVPTSAAAEQSSLHTGTELMAANLDKDQQGLYALLYGGLMSHHMCAIFPFCWSLVTHELAGVCLFGLLIEFPVLLLNLRDMFVSFEGELFEVQQWKKVYIIRFWLVFQSFWHMTRSASCVLYFVSLGVWRSQIHVLLSPASRIVYHILGVLFNWINFVLLCFVLPLYLFEDLKRYRSDDKEGDYGSDRDREATRATVQL